MVYAPVRPDPSLPRVRVNLFSDTQTRPSAAMKEAMMRAEVGDEQNGDDPTVNALCDRMAALTGKQAAVFLPTGTMCNQISILVHCQPGDEILAHESSHIIVNEGGGPGALAGAVVLGLRGERGCSIERRSGRRCGKGGETRRRKRWSRSSRQRTPAADRSGRRHC